MLDLESLLAPMADDAPCGSDLEYDPVFLELQSAAAGKPEQQYGDKLIPAEGPDWRMVHDSALTLAGRTRDLRVAVWLLRSRARLSGLSAALEVLPLIHGLALRHWDHVHPQLDASDNNDPTMRLNALAPLISADAALADLRAARLGEARGTASVREIELALDRGLPQLVPLPGESAPTEAGAREAMAAALAATPELGVALQAAVAAAGGLSDLLVERVGKVQAPDLKDLCRLLQCLADAALPAAQRSDAEGAATAARPSAGAAAGPLGAPQSRDDVIKLLDRACQWIEHNEPSHPAPLLIRRAQRLMSKSFLEIVRDLAPDGLNQIERLAGHEPASD